MLISAGSHQIYIPFIYVHLVDIQWFTLLDNDWSCFSVVHEDEEWMDSSFIDHIANDLALQFEQVTLQGFEKIKLFVSWARLTIVAFAKWNM